MKIKNGQTCAAFVLYAGKSYSWIVCKFEKKQPNNKCIVRDDYCESQNFLRYVVDQNSVIPFPQPNETYKPGEQIIALWYDATDNEWSTMFYEAEVVEVSTPHLLVIKYSGSQANIEIDAQKVSKYPEKFNMPQEPETEDKKEETSETGDEGSKDQSEDNQQPKYQFQLLKHHESPQEARRLNLMLDNKSAPKEKPEFKSLTDDDFTKLAGPRPKPKKMTTTKGTPLIDFLQDEVLFPKQAPHITGNGLLRRKGITPPTNPSGLLEGSSECGRLNKILHEWRPVP
ncbi:hypothetical protein TVAG_130310 [Trichomonas vaginalis G3]|uniref:SGF29 C-terminal domain-containing protein n=1 Tax=Trichomonas vaginalis (strain ATCC PRA-98 / G3) TaxID=412133 RepID=A2DIC7_TRIV3|nr:SGF29 tudor-like domain family [Trichomonas vaginalis G3]EAY19923.1 hypothetical protein TVAG_130310 [Trichomonas vaginalis G3]KAI5509942.1 SGF29 tudor-like domain family [Trichomonas vaginalis G3]|eukprot:XP_001580909.1 hypothetical protein [Trichomonas vaginalis G3]